MKNNYLLLFAITLMALFALYAFDRQRVKALQEEVKFLSCQNGILWKDQQAYADTVKGLELQLEFCNNSLNSK
ncbi:hypothetical protein [Siphonobacter sp. SORGH_AS_1065]|uniref:hypothetical protein n=1 Tax=Siphonobacter sp. SORGH_AS_1065 TaxID=3041795 RepID=UPI0027D7ABD5|nr:hypothetical protein [Siphonobacter sp. SORGH_AS_1065]